VYDSLFETFDSPLARRIRREAYDEDIGQHSWVTARDLRADIERLALTSERRLLDLGCGPGGPLTWIAASVGCAATGLDVSPTAVAAARARAAARGLDRVTILQADLDEPLCFDSGSFDIAMALDSVLHMRDRRSLFGEVARVLSPGGRFIFKDAGVVTGSITNHEIAARSAHGRTHFVPPGFNEHTLAGAGFRLLECVDRTTSLVANAGGRLAARAAHRDELEAVEGRDAFAHEQTFLETVVALARNGSLSRFMYLATIDDERRAA
jgi:SAM-dependent methyltransferase